MRDRVPSARASSSSSSHVVAGRLAVTPDLLTRCWMPPGELSRQFLTLDTSLEPVFVLETSTHVSLLFLKSLFLT